VTLARLLASALIAVGTAYVFFIGGLPAGTGLAQLRMVSLVIIAVALAAWAIAARRDPSWRPRSVLLPALAASVLAMAMSTVFSRSPRVSVEYLVFAVLLAALYLLLVRLMAQPRLRQRILVVAAGSGTFIALAFLGVVALLWVQFWTLLGGWAVPPSRPSAEALIFTTPNLVAPMVVLLGSILIGLVAGRSRMARAVRVASVILIAASLLMTGSRGSWIGAIVGCLSLGVAFAYAGGLYSAVLPVWSRIRGVGPVWLTVAGLALIAVGVLVAPAFIGRFADSGGNRLTFWRIALQLFQESPLTGAGPGLWGASRIAYTLPTEGDEYVPLAHNLYMQTLGELGLVGLGAGIVVVLTLLWLLRDALRDRDPLRRRWALVLAFTSGYFAAHQLVDAFVNIPATFLAFGIPVALLDATAERRPGLLPTWSTAITSKPIRIVGGIAVAAALLVALLVEAIGLRHAEAVALANEGRWAEANAVAAMVVASDPGMPAYWLTAGLAAAHVGDYRTAADRFKRIAEIGDLPQAWLDLADAYAHLGENALAHDALVRSLRLGWQQVAVNLVATEVAIRLGDMDLATETAAHALGASPSLADDPWWTDDQQRSQIFEAARDAIAEGSGPAAAWPVALYARDLEGATAMAEMLDAGNREDALDVIAAWRGDPGAVDSLKAACLARADETALLTWCARVAAKLGTQDATRFRDLAMILLIPNDYLANLEIATDTTSLAVAGNAGELYGVHAYRRFTPWDMLSPGLPHLTIA
jgi:O-antigen ligase